MHLLRQMFHLFLNSMKFPKFVTKRAFLKLLDLIYCTTMSSIDGLRVLALHPDLGVEICPPPQVKLSALSPKVLVDRCCHQSVFSLEQS